MLTTVHRVPLTRKLLAKLPQAERKWVFFLGHVTNEVTFLSKLLLWSHREPGDSRDLRNVAAAAQTIMVAKLLVGKEYEAAQTLQQSYFNSAIRRIYRPLMRQEGQHAEGELEAYFTANNLHHRVRNSFAFHYSLNELSGEITRSAKGEELAMILSESHGNALFGMSEVVANRAMLATIDPADARTAIETFSNSVIKVAGWYQFFADSFIEAVLRKRWGDDLSAWGGEDVAIPAESFSATHIPWFFAGR